MYIIPQDHPVWWDAFLWTQVLYTDSGISATLMSLGLKPASRIKISILNYYWHFEKANKGAGFKPKKVKEI